MLLVTHILIALSSIAYTAVTYFRPSQAKFYSSYGLVAATLVSGTILVITTHSPLLESCLSGLLYLGVVLSGTVAAHYKLRGQENDD